MAAEGIAVMLVKSRTWRDAPTLRFIFFVLSGIFFNRKTFVLRISARKNNALQTIFSNSQVNLIFFYLPMNMPTEVQHYIFSPLLSLNTDNLWEKSHGESMAFKENTIVIR